MDIKSLVRNAAKVHACLYRTTDGGLWTNKEVKIYIPTRFNERQLASVGADTYIVGIYAIVVEDKYYGVSNVNAMMKITPSSILTVRVDDDEYYEFTFDANTCVIANTKLVKTNTLVYRIYDEILSKGRVPWYMGYVELGKIFDTAKYHAGANIGENREVTELLVSLVSRDKGDRHLYYRSTIRTREDLIKKDPVFIPLKSVTYAATSTINRMGGSYMETGIISALNTPSTRVEKLDKLIRT